MKNVLLLAWGLVLLGTGCADKNLPPHPAPGTIVASQENPIEGAKDHGVYKVVVKADSLDAVYDVCAVYGHDTANGRFIMPKGIGAYTIVLKKGKTNEYVVGFTEPKDTAFNDYFQVMVEHGAYVNGDAMGMQSTISMNYLKAYTYE